MGVCGSACESLFVSPESLAYGILFWGLTPLALPALTISIWCHLIVFLLLREHCKPHRNGRRGPLSTGWFSAKAGQRLQRNYRIHQWRVGNEIHAPRDVVRWWHEIFPHRKKWSLQVSEKKTDFWGWKDGVHPSKEEISVTDVFFFGFGSRWLCRVSSRCLMSQDA